MALAETHYRQDIPWSRFSFDGYQAWHADRGGQDKVTKSYTAQLIKKQLSTNSSQVLWV